MSTDWDLYCLDCKSDHGFYDANHEEKAVQRLVDLMPRFAAMPGLAALMKDAGFVPVGNGDGDGLYNHRLSLRWVEEHCSHRVVARNEYGDFLEQCPETTATCECCGQYFACRLLPGHEGPHLPKRP